MRAVVMSAVMMLVDASGERYDGLSSLMFSAIIVFAISPFQLFDIGCQLSYTVVLGILLLSGRIARLFSFCGEKISGSLGVILSAQIASFPVSLFYFGEVSGVAIVCNFFMIPFCSSPFFCLRSSADCFPFPSSRSLFPNGAFTRLKGMSVVFRSVASFDRRFYVGLWGDRLVRDHGVDGRNR